MLGGSDIPAVGFSIGVDRLLLLIEQMEGGFAPVPSCDVYVCAMTDAARLPAQLVALRLRRAGIAAMTDLQRKSGKAQLKDADRTMATWAILLGQDELDENTVMLKNLRTQEQRAVSLEHLLTEIQRS